MTAKNIFKRLKTVNTRLKKNLTKDSFVINWNKELKKVALLNSNLIIMQS